MTTMTLADVSIDAEVAKERVEHYRAMRKEERTLEDQAIARAYAVAARGKPVIIRRIGGDLWEVLATWDLTDIERAVITGTRNA